MQAGWVFSEAGSTLRSSLAFRMFIREHPLDQHLWKGRWQNWAEEELGCSGGLTAWLTAQGALDGPSEFCCLQLKVATWKNNIYVSSVSFKPKVVKS